MTTSSDALRAVLLRLGADLSSRLGGAWTSRLYERLHQAGPALELWSPGAVLEVIVHDDVAMVRLHGDREPCARFPSEGADDAGLVALASSIDAARGRLTVERLEPGRRYRVSADARTLRRGDVVTFVHFEDVDNHFGRLVFEDASGTRRTVEGDFSSRDYEVARVHQYLETYD